MTQRRHQKIRFHKPYLGRSVEVTIVAQLVWITGFVDQPYSYLVQLRNQEHIHWENVSNLLDIHRNPNFYPCAQVIKIQYTYS